MAVRDIASLLVGVLLLFLTGGVRAGVEVNMEDRVEVMRGQTAEINCIFMPSDDVGDVMIQWLYTDSASVTHTLYYQDSAMGIVEKDTPFSDRISVNVTGATGTALLTITDVKLGDEQEFICQIRSKDGTGQGRTLLKVFETPELPTIEGYQTGIWVNNHELSKIGACETKNGYPKPNITWYRDKMPLHNFPDEVDSKPVVVVESSRLFSVKSELSMRVMRADKDALFYCEVSYYVPGGMRMTETRRIQVNVQYPSTAITMSVESPQGLIKEGDTVELQCLGNGNPQPAFTLKHGVTETILDSNVAVLNNVTRLNNGVYHCTTLDMDTYEEISGNTTLFANYLDDAVVDPQDPVVSQGEELTATCNALSSLKTHTVWFKDGEEVSKGHTLRLKDAMFDTAGTYVCMVTVPQIEGLETSGSLRVFVQGPPEITEPLTRDIEESKDTTINLSCHARGFPTPHITWSASDGQDLKMVTEEITEDSIHSTVSIKVTSDMNAFCNASNNEGVASVAYSIKAIRHTTTLATTTSTTTTSTTTSSPLSTTTVIAESAIPPKRIKKEKNGVIIAVVIICILLLAILGAVLYFLYKKGKICGRSGKQDLTKEKSTNDNIVVEMKSDNTEEAVLLGINGDRKPAGEQ
ncbi:melanoma cell adhesion molecule b isoform X2 [Genypterus blacodes]|uniref:melanoma cell adhesion molecule b isoform X2 n=1 Tax=Genypterus blacodes TaxID=154954 RepID=UPI003F75F876